MYGMWVGYGKYVVRKVKSKSDVFFQPDAQNKVSKKKGSKNKVSKKKK